MNSKARKLQSATEYLMTYGWSILIIAIVLGTLYYLGIFSGASTATTACIATPGYYCHNPTLSSSGSLKLYFGVIGSAVTVTSIGCSNSSSAPSTFSSITPTLMQNNEVINLTFQCPGIAPQIGASFKGTLWIVYSMQSQSGLIAQIGAVSAKVSYIASNAVQNESLGYVPITLTNSQSSATGSNFQQMITVPSSSYSQYIYSGWSNVEFTSGAPAGSGGTALNAWVESGASNTASSTVVWVRLSNSISANSNAIIYMNFMGSNVLSSNGPTGEAPQLSCSNPGNTISGCGSNQYAKYDNGGLVFPTLYQNFAGTSTPSGWTYTGAAGNIKQDNGLIQITGDHSSYASMATSSTYGLNSAQVLDGFVDTSGISDSDFEGFFGYITQSSDADEIFWWTGGESTESPWAYDGGSWDVGTLDSPLNQYDVLSVYWPSGSGATFDYNYGTTETLSSQIPPSALHIGMYVAEQISYNAYIQWIRIRAYPPNGVMPDASFGSYV